MKTIAIVEDSEDNRLLVQAILEGRYQLTLHTSGLEALEAFRAQRPDGILIDISLPGMDGPELLRRMRADERLRDIPAIALTAHAMAGDREKFLGLGFDDYVSKPIVEEQMLLNAIERVLGKAR